MHFTSQLVQLTSRDDISQHGWRELVSYGIGSLSSSPRARLQFALAEALRRALKVEDAFYFDPVTTATEREVFKAFDWHIIAHDEEGKRPAASQGEGGVGAEDQSGGSAGGGGDREETAALRSGTVFFMPHCPFRLYSNVLWANWSPEALTRCCVVGNSFNAYDVRLIGATESKASASNCVLRLLPFTTERSPFSKEILESPSGDESSPEMRTQVPIATQHARDLQLLAKHSTGLEAIGDLAVMTWKLQKESDAKGLTAAVRAGVFDQIPPEEFGVSHGGW
jgi:hypothetical protein